MLADSVGVAAAGLFFHAVAVGAGLAVLIVLFLSVSGSHFNPAVTLAMWRAGRLEGSTATRYAVAPVTGAVVGVWLAHVSFGEPVFSVASTVRTGWGPVVSELVGTLVLVLLIFVLVDQDRRGWIGPGVGAWVAAVVSTSSTGFLNPAVTIARAFTDSYTGISPAGVPGFIAAQLVGGLLAVVILSRLRPVPEMKET